MLDDQCFLFSIYFIGIFDFFFSYFIGILDHLLIKESDSQTCLKNVPLEDLKLDQIHLNHCTHHDKLLCKICLYFILVLIKEQNIDNYRILVFEFYGYIKNIGKYWWIF